VPSAASRPAAAAMAVALALSGPAIAQVLYKWIDADGKTQYSDQPPKKHQGPVTRIEPDVAPTPAPPRKPAAATPAAAPAKAVPPEDPTAKRRATRAALEKRLVAARDKLDAARKALAETSDPEPEERQVVQQTAKMGGGMHGLSGARSNCRVINDKGKAAVSCPTTILKEEYFDRVGKLEEAVRVAEAELAEAEQAWRRGVD
jgi:hypothetical protein